MYVFLVLIIPLMYSVSEYLCRGRKPSRERTGGVFFGLVAACIYTLIHFFAVGTSHIWINSVSSVRLYFFLTEIALPSTVCLFVVLIGRDRLRDKIAYIFPVMAAFFAVFVPYRVLAAGTPPDAFRMIMYPLLAAAMLFNFDTATFVFEGKTDIRPRLWLRCIITVAGAGSGLALPPLFLADWFLNRVGFLTYLLAVLYVLFSAGLRILAMLFLPQVEKEGQVQ